ncbi:MAG: hypothetical protein V9G24_08525 [Rhodoblastus sp.]
MWAKTSPPVICEQSRMSIVWRAREPCDCRARARRLNPERLLVPGSCIRAMSILARASLGRRTFGRLALAGLGVALAATLAGCGGEAACDNEIVKERAIEAVRAQYPNEVSKELLKRGSIPALDRILKERNLDQKDEKQLEVAARAAVQEMEDAWKAGRFTLENAGHGRIRPEDQQGLLPGAHGVHDCLGHIRARCELRSVHRQWAAPGDGDRSELIYTLLQLVMLVF